MKVVCVCDAFITKEMMEDSVRPYLSEGDTIESFFFGEFDKVNMRDIVKSIEARNFEGIPMPEGLYESIEDADLMIVHLCPIKRDLIERAKSLKAIMSCRGGLENIEVDAATEHGIIVSNNPAHNANAVAEREIEENEFIKGTFFGVADNLDEIDSLIASKSEGWNLDRISKVSRAAMRLCIYEMKWADTPMNIAINEAVEIVKKYDDVKAKGFVNGILNAIAKDTDK